MTTDNGIFYWNTNVPFSVNKKKFLRFIVENVEEIENYPDVYDSPNETYILIQEGKSDKIHIVEPNTHLIAKDKDGHFYTRRTEKHEGYY